MVLQDVAIGHRCCSATLEQLKQLSLIFDTEVPAGPCLNKLKKPTNRFCAEHQVLLGGLRHVQPCQDDKSKDNRACAGPDHIDVMEVSDLSEGDVSDDSSAHEAPHAGTLQDLPTVEPGQERGHPHKADLEMRPAEEADHLHEEDSETQQAAEPDNSHEGDFEAEEVDHPHERDHSLGAQVPTTKLSGSPARSSYDELIISACGCIVARKSFYHPRSLSAVAVSDYQRVSWEQY